MIYTPQKYPKKAVVMIFLIAAVGIIGGYLIHDIFFYTALVFWMHYTLILSYMQLNKWTKHKRKTLTDYLLHPQIRFFLFQAIAVSGFLGLLLYDLKVVAASALLAWIAFSINFYRHYSQFKKYE